MFMIAIKDQTIITMQQSTRNNGTYYKWVQCNTVIDFRKMHNFVIAILCII
jgi:hypothetical protein